MDILRDMYVERESITEPRRIKRMPDGGLMVYSLMSSNERGHVTGICCMELVSVCVSYGNRYDEPPEFDVESVGELLIKPVMMCWGRGKKNA